MQFLTSDSIKKIGQQMTMSSEKIRRSKVWFRSGRIYAVAWHFIVCVGLYWEFVIGLCQCHRACASSRRILIGKYMGTGHFETRRLILGCKVGKDQGTGKKKGKWQVGNLCLGLQQFPNLKQMMAVFP